MARQEHANVSVSPQSVCSHSTVQPATVSWLPWWGAVLLWQVHGAGRSSTRGAARWGVLLIAGSAGQPVWATRSARAMSVVVMSVPPRLTSMKMAASSARVETLASATGMRQRCSMMRRPFSVRSSTVT